ncbi:MarR family winged helix-turn-helix transcriptional regulator [Streptacidiphilus carbonis]|uniref:MarR family winged helix-turn-helix transcriptional regulator n=1 Tax=Streptacidiphilus carbonis TaxID=105422 RepID=UPI0005AACDA6|nr:MarR family winged helix-turn-helix transcriptional regulator [Streptacidiphilus carbonis]
MVERDQAKEANELAEVLGGLQRMMRRVLRQELSGARLRGAQVELLRLVKRRPGIGVAAAAKELHLAGNSVSTLVNQLVAAGFLEREADPRDRRAALLTVTAAARQRMAEWEARRGELIRRHVAGLPPEDRDALAAALPALRRLTEGLHSEVEGT